VAIYRFSAQVIGRSSGRSATAAAAYRAGVEIVDQRTGLVHDYTRRSGVESAFVVAPESAPAWAHDRAALWNAVELGEKRKDAQLTREVQLALPHELDAEQRRALVERFVREQWVSAGMVADVALHAPDQEGDDRNQHAHVMLTLRSIGPEGFGPKVREWNDKARLEGWREAWQEHANRALELAGRSERIDHRSLAAQRAAAVKAGEVERADELDRAPEPKLGPVPTLDLRRHRRDAEPTRTERAEQWLGVQVENEQRRGLLRRLREGFRELAADGVAAFERRYEQISQGIEAFKAKAQTWLVEQVKAAQEREFQASLRREQEAGRQRNQRGPSRDDGPGLGVRR
jgi:ATP-dependent exoDNAse (exonuclease V) alpha subunit